MTSEPGTPLGEEWFTLGAPTGAVPSATAHAVDRVVDIARYAAAVAAERLEWVDALRRHALEDATVQGRTLTDVVLRGIRLELASALRVTEYTAGRMLTVAEALLHEHPPVFVALAQGQITEQHADVLVDAVALVEPGLRERVVAQALELARVEPVGVFRRKLRTLIEQARSLTLAQRHAQALQQRRVVMEPDADGMAWLHLHAPAVEVHAAYDRITRMAKIIAKADAEQTADADAALAPPRTLDQTRADVLCDLLIDGDTTHHPETARGIRATVAVTVPVLTLLAADPADPAAMPTVEGIGPIPLARAKELCGGADGWMRILTHPETGMVLSVGRDQYRPPPSLRKLVKWRAERCMAPGCGVPASRCEIDHTIAWEHGGSTTLQNLAPLCKGHHTVKHHGGWDVHQDPGGGGALHWTSPTGRHYTVQPERKVPVFRPATGSGDPPPF